MSDPRFNSIHLEASPRRDDFRRARARLLGTCGQHTLAVDHERLGEAAEMGPCTIIEHPSEKPSAIGCWLKDPDGLYPLKPGLNSVGRMPDNDVVIADGSVSRRHCAIVLHSGGICELHDTASKNGTFINGKRIYGPTRLVAGDEIRMCDHTVVFQTEAGIQKPEDAAHAPTIG
jgi:hypothetical protein